MNKFIITGNLTKTPEMKYSQAGNAYTKFTVAVTRPRDRDKSDFFNVTAFGKVAESVANYLDKGSKVLVEGQVNIDNNNGTYYTNVLADNVEFLSKKGETSQSSNQSNTSNPLTNNDPFANNDGGQAIEISEDTLPF